MSQIYIDPKSGIQHLFPDDATPDEISQATAGASGPMTSGDRLHEAYTNPEFNKTYSSAQFLRDFYVRNLFGPAMQDTGLTSPQTSDRIGNAAYSTALNLPTMAAAGQLGRGPLASVLSKIPGAEFLVPAASRTAVAGGTEAVKAEPDERAGAFGRGAGINAILEAILSPPAVAALKGMVPGATGRAIRDVGKSLEDMKAAKMEAPLSGVSDAERARMQAEFDRGPQRTNTWADYNVENPKSDLVAPDNRQPARNWGVKNPQPPVQPEIPHTGASFPPGTTPGKVIEAYKYPTPPPPPESLLRNILENWGGTTARGAAEAGGGALGAILRQAKDRGTAADAGQNLINQDEPNKKKGGADRDLTQ